MNFFLIIEITHLFLISPKIISQKFDYNLGRPVLSLNYNGDDSNIKSFINTFHPFTLIERRYFKSLIDNLILNKKILNLDYEKEVVEYETEVTFESIVIKGYHIYIFFSHSWYPDQGIGLAYKFDNENFSLVHLLYKNKAIDKKMFAIYFDNINHKGVVSFGGIPSNAHLKYKMKSYCNVNDEYTSWGCNLTSITFNNTSQPVNYYAALNNGFYGIMYSDKIFDFFTNHIFQNEIVNNICSINKEGKKSKSFFLRCKPMIENNYLDITFSFGNMKLKLKLKDLFEKNNKFYDSLIFSNNYNMYKKYDILLGSNFFTFFSYIIFDYDNQKIEFYSNSTSISMIVLHEKNTIKFVFIILNIICLIMIIILLLLLFILIKGKRNKHQQTF